MQPSRRALLLITIALAILAACGPGRAPDPPPPPVVREISVATWNVRNFFDTVDDPGSDTVLSATEFSQKRSAVGAALRSLDADVVVLQEVENERVVEALRSEELADLGYGPAVVSQGNDTRLINIAVLSRYPIVSLASHRSDTFTSPTSGATYRFARDCLELEIDVEGVRWAILAVHFISKSGGDASDDRRLAEAARVRALVDAHLTRDPRARVLVAGDLNDQPGSPALVRLMGSGDTALADVSAGLAPEVRYTYVFSGRRELIDFILASPEAVSFGVEAWIVHNGPALATSDHAPVRARFLPPP